MVRQIVHFLNSQIDKILLIDGVDLSPLLVLHRAVSAFVRCREGPQHATLRIAYVKCACVFGMLS